MCNLGCYCIVAAHKYSIQFLGKFSSTSSVSSFLAWGTVILQRRMKCGSSSSLLPSSFVLQWEKKSLTCTGLWSEIAGCGVQKGSTKHSVVLFLQVYFRQWQSKIELLSYCLYGKIHGEVGVKVWCISYEEQATEPVLLKCQARAFVTLKNRSCTSFSS